MTKLKSELVLHFITALSQMPESDVFKIQDACTALACFMQQCGASEFDRVMTTAAPGNRMTPAVHFAIPFVYRGESLDKRIDKLRQTVRPLGFVIGVEPDCARIEMAYVPYEAPAKVDEPFWKKEWFQSAVVISLAVGVATYFSMKTED